MDSTPVVVKRGRGRPLKRKSEFKAEEPNGQKDAQDGSPAECKRGGKKVKSEASELFEDSQLSPASSYSCEDSSSARRSSTRRVCKPKRSEMYYEYDKSSEEEDAYCGSSSSGDADAEAEEKKIIIAVENSGPKKRGRPRKNPEGGEIVGKKLEHAEMRGGKSENLGKRETALSIVKSVTGVTTKSKIKKLEKMAKATTNEGKMDGGKSKGKTKSKQRYDFATSQTSATNLETDEGREAMDEKMKGYEEIYEEDVKACAANSKFMLSPKVFDKSQTRNHDYDSNDLITCGRCEKDMPLGHYLRKHRLRHYYLSWIKDKEPKLDLFDDEVLKKHLARACNKDAAKKGVIKFICETCSNVKKSVVGFISHLRFCNKIFKEEFMMQCDVCLKMLKPSSMNSHKKIVHGEGKNKVEETVVDDSHEVTNDSFTRKSKIKAKDTMKKIAKEMNAGGQVENRDENWIDFSVKQEEGSTTTEGSSESAESEDASNEEEEVSDGSKNKKRRKRKYCSSGGGSGKDFKISLREIAMEELAKDRGEGGKSGRKSDEGSNAVAAISDPFEDESLAVPPSSPSSVGSWSSIPSAPSGANGVVQKNLKNKKKKKKKKMEYEYEFRFRSDDEESDSDNKTDEEDEYGNDPVLEGATDARSLLHTLYLTVNLRKVIHSDKVLLEDFFVDMSAWKRFRLDEKDAYLPEGKESCDVYFGNCETAVTYDLFQADIVDGAANIFAGGPVCSLAWAPLPDDICQQYLAVSCYKNFDYVLNFNNAHHFTNCLQLWKFQHLQNDAALSKPRMCVSICHDFGAITSMEWLPSGGYDELAGRLGVLAIASSSGALALYSIPIFEAVEGGKEEEAAAALWTKAKPDVVLKKFGKQCACTKVIWETKTPHRKIIAGFSDGIIAFWLISKNKFDAVPVRTIIAHNCPITALSLNFACNNRYLLTGSTEKKFHLWDLNDDCAGPFLTHDQVNPILDGAWMQKWSLAFFVCDLVFTLYPTNVICNMDGDLAQKFIREDGIVWSVSISDWSDTIFISTDSGRVVGGASKIYVDVDGKEFFASYEKYVTVTDVMEKGTDVMEGGGCSVEGNSHESYAKTAEKFALKITDSVANKPLKKDANMDRYNLESVNKVCCNQNYGSYDMLAIGYQCGFVRVLKSSRFGDCKSGLDAYKRKKNDDH